MHKVRRGSVSVALALAVLTACSSGESATVLPQPEETQSIEVGRMYHFVVSTHCGVRFINVDGSRWRIEDGTVPAGWGPGGQPGRLKLVSADKAVFRSMGHRLTFVRQKGKPLSACL